MTSYVLLTIFFATLVRSTVGFGEALVAVPLLALRLPLATAAPLAVLISAAMAALIVVQDFAGIEWRSAGGLVLAALPGIPLGVLLVSKGNDHVVKAILGAVLVGFSLYSLRSSAVPHVREDHRGWLIVCGFLSGVLGGAYGMNGPPLAIYGAFRRWSPQRFRATLQGYFLFASAAGLIGYAKAGIWNANVSRYFLLSLPVVVVAVLIGRALNRRLTGARFLRVVYTGLAVIGGVLLVQAA